jgi:hypothetical protein
MRWGYHEEFLPNREVQREEFSIEMHWSLSSYSQVIRAVPVEPLFDRARPITAHGFQMYVLDPIDALVHAALHLIYKHTHDVRLIWLYDIHQLARQMKPESWPEVVRRSVEWQARLALIKALQLADEWFGGGVAQEALDLERWSPAESELTIYRLANDRLTSPAKLHWLRRHWVQLSSLSLKERLIYVKGRLFPAPEEIRMRYPRVRSWALPVAYAKRLFWVFVERKSR